MPIFLLLDFFILILIRFFVKIFITVFGWATEIFFGKLPDKNKGWFYLMIVLSFIWIYFLVATAFPILFNIFKYYVPQNSLTSIFKRVLYILCVVGIPPAVGLIGAKITGVTKSDKKKYVECIIRGYRYSAMLGCAMAVILVCAPVIRIKRITKKIVAKSMDMHVAGKGNIYVMDEIRASLSKIGISSTKKIPSKFYSLPIKMINGIMREMFDYVSDRDFYVSGEKINVYINSADIMLEGKADLVEKAQSAIVKGFVENDIFLTNNEKSQKIEFKIFTVYKRWENHEISDGEAIDTLRNLANIIFDEDMTYNERALLSVQINEVQNNVLAKKTNYEAL
ncbi:MAG: hypothetical protein VB119_00895 [Candidatus Metalachnospira sp.]|nr:hypothetical protein [Candidatus Metalachnospira sp.]